MLVTHLEKMAGSAVGPDDIAIGVKRLSLTCRGTTSTHPSVPASIPGRVVPVDKVTRVCTVPHK